MSGTRRSKVRRQIRCALRGIGELAGQWGGEEAGRQRVDAHATPSPLLGEMPGEGDQPALRGVVARHAAAGADLPEDRRNVDH